MGEYLNHFFFLPPLNQDGIHNPTTPAHHMMRYVLLSHMSRSFGAIARYNLSSPLASSLSITLQNSRTSLVPHLTPIAPLFTSLSRSEEFISTARQVSGQVFDDPSYDSGVAFMLLADICLANGDARASHYASVAWNHAKVVCTSHSSYILFSPVMYCTFLLFILVVILYLVISKRLVQHPPAAPVICDVQHARHESHS